MTRTLVYVGVAVVTCGLAVWKGMPSTEMNRLDSAQVGEPFFPDFKDPTEATGIRILVYEEDTAEIKPFQVQYEDGRWRIPSHYNYPADGEEQLAKTASSLVGIERGAVAGESEQDFQRLGVIDPTSEGDESLRGRGDRLTLMKDGKPLVDLIIGKKVPDQENAYYVRKPDQNITYITPLEIDLSTDFQDWINAKLLDVSQNALRRVQIKDYSVNETTGSIDQKGEMRLSRDNANDPWELGGLNEETEELKTSAVSSMTSALAGLEIIGVRPKPSGLSSSLRLTGEVTPEQRAMRDLSSKGFYFARTPDGSFELVSNEGELISTTADGVEYVLQFGEVFTGDEFEIEVGSASDEGEASETEEKADENATEKESDFKESRYLFVKVNFNQDLLGPPPTKPEPPKDEAPSEKDESSKEEPSSEKSAETTGTEETEAENIEKSESAENESNKEADEKSDAEKQYEQALKEYEKAQAEYEKKVADAKNQVKDLNDRFADWYYVIDAASFNRLHKSREDLVEPKEKEETTETETSSPTTPEKSEAETTADEKPAEMKKPAEESSDNSEKPAEDADSEKKPEPKEAAPESSEKSEAGEKKESPESEPSNSEEKPAPEAENEESPAEN